MANRIDEISIKVTAIWEVRLLIKTTDNSEVFVNGHYGLKYEINNEETDDITKIIGWRVESIMDGTGYPESIRIVCSEGTVDITLEMGLDMTGVNTPNDSCRSVISFT